MPVHRLKAHDCTLVTRSSRLSKQCRAWLERCRAEHRPIRKGETQRREGHDCSFSCFKNRIKWTLSLNALVLSLWEAGTFPDCRLGISVPIHSSSEDVGDPPLRPCQVDCLDACGKGARIVEMACGTGKTRVMKELVGNVSGSVSWLTSSCSNKTAVCGL